MRKLSLAASLPAATAILFIAFGNAEARILNVPEDYQTIQTGIDAAQDHDTVLVLPGVYQENILLQQRAIVLASHILTTGDDAYIDSTVIDGNESGSAISILNCLDSTLTISGFKVTGSDAAGIFCRNSSGRLEYLHITENHNTHGVAPGYGGGMFCYDTTYLSSKITLAHSRIDNNRAAQSLGGGIATLWYNMNIFDVVIADNEARFAGGGAYFALTSTIDMEDVSVLANSCPSEGGGIFTNCGAHVIGKNVEIRNNHSSSNGGGCYASGNGRFSLTNSLVFDNEADSAGGGLYLSSSQRHYFTNTLVGFNIAEIGSAVYMHAQPLAEFRNAIIRGEGESLVFVDQNSWISVNYSCVSGGENSIVGENVVWRDGNIDSDPLFLDPDNGDFSLTADSPCIDAGDPDSPPDPDGTRADMGAFYFHQRDIEVEPLELTFPPINWESLDSQSVSVRNSGGNDLHTTLYSPPYPTFFYSRDDRNTKTILPDSTFTYWIHFHPEERYNGFFSLEATFWIFSDDPDDSLSTINVVGSVANAVPSDILHSSLFTLHSAFPNPFNATTTIRFSSGPITTSLRVYGIDGRLVADLTSSVASPQATGGKITPPTPPALARGDSRTVIWNAEGLPGGIYFVKLEAGNQVRTIKTLLMK